MSKEVGSKRSALEGGKYIRGALEKCSTHWITGKWVSINEQMIGFKGQHGLALHITYKREGDEYQCDAVCAEGYTFSFYFRHDDAPELQELKHMDLSPTAR